MIPVMCRVGHYPERGLYGDCFRACVASILEVGSDIVPHFYENNETGPEAMQRLSDFLKPLGYAPFTCVYDGDASRDEILEMMMSQNRDTYYMLFGRVSGGDHVVVCRGGTVAHDPAWYPGTMTECNSAGAWVIMVLARS